MVHASGAAEAQASVAPADPAGIAEVLLDIRRPIGPDFSARGAIAFAVSRVFRESDGSTLSELWMTDSNGRNPDSLGIRGSWPKWDPAGEHIAYASDRDSPGQNSILGLVSAGARKDREWWTTDGTIEDVVWDSNDSVLVQVADAGAPSQSMYGAISPKAAADPAVFKPEPHWRRVFRIDAAGAAAQIPIAGWTIWEFCRAGDDRLLAVASQDPSENGWYASALVLIDRATGAVDPLFWPRWQIACPTVSPDLGRAAVIEAWASDRGLVMGEVRVVDLGDRTVQPLSPPGDATFIRWRD